MKANDKCFATKGLVALLAGRCCCLLQQQRGPQLTTFPRFPRILALLAVLTTLGVDPAQAQITVVGNVTNGGAQVPPAPTSPFAPVNLIVGDTARGALTITNGATVTNNGDAIITNSIAAVNSTASVSGSTSQWTNTGQLIVGKEFFGSLDIAGGGLVTAASVGIGIVVTSGGVLATEEIVEVPPPGLPRP